MNSGIHDAWSAVDTILAVRGGRRRRRGQRRSTARRAPRSATRTCRPRPPRTSATCRSRTARREARATRWSAGWWATPRPPRRTCAEISMLTSARDAIARVQPSSPRCSSSAHSHGRDGDLRVVVVPPVTTPGGAARSGSVPLLPVFVVQGLGRQACSSRRRATRSGWVSGASWPASRSVVRRALGVEPRRACGRTGSRPACARRTRGDRHLLAAGGQRVVGRTRGRRREQRVRPGDELLGRGRARDRRERRRGQPGLRRGGAPYRARTSAGTTSATEVPGSGAGASSSTTCAIRCGTTAAAASATTPPCECPTRTTSCRSRSSSTATRSST